VFDLSKKKYDTLNLAELGDNFLAEHGYQEISWVQRQDSIDLSMKETTG